MRCGAPGVAVWQTPASEGLRLRGGRWPDSSCSLAGLLPAAEGRAHFLALVRGQTDSAVRRRINALALLDDGWTAERVGGAQCSSARTRCVHKQRFPALGRTGVECLDHVGHAPVLTWEQGAVRGGVDP